MEKIIKEASKELMLGMIETIPENPVFYSLKFDKKGTSYNGKTFDAKHHIESCIENNAVPFSSMDYVYDPDKGIFYTKLDTSFFRNMFIHNKQITEELSNLTTEKMLTGGSPAKLHVSNVYVEFDRKSFGVFRDKVLPELLKEYDFSYGELALTTRRNCADNYGHSFNADSKLELYSFQTTLKLGFMPPKQEKMYLDWWDNLTNKDKP